MPYDPSGNFSRVHSWKEDRDNGIRILADRHDEEDDNFADGFNLAFMRNGIVPMTGNLNMGSNKIVAISAGSEPLPGLTFELSGATGLWQVNNNALGFSTNGVKRLEVNNGGININGNLTLTGQINGGSVNFAGNIAAVNAAFSGTLGVTGDTTLAKLTAGATTLGTLACGAITTNARATLAGGADIADISTGYITSTGGANFGGVATFNQANVSNFYGGGGQFVDLHVTNGLTVDHDAVVSGRITTSAISCNGQGSFLSPNYQTAGAVMLYSRSGYSNAFLQFINGADGGQNGYVGINDDKTMSIGCAGAGVNFNSPILCHANATFDGKVGIGGAVGAEQLTVINGIGLGGAGRHVYCVDNNAQLILSGGTALGPSGSIVCRGSADGYNPGGVNFYAGNVEVVAISNAGNFGLGTTSPNVGGTNARILAVDHNVQSMIDLRASGTPRGRLWGQNSGFLLEANPYFTFSAPGGVICTMENTYIRTNGCSIITNIHGSGEVGAVSNAYSRMNAFDFHDVSDAREKNWRGEATASELNAADTILSKLGFYTWKDRPGLHFGVKAQDVAQAFMDAGVEAQQSLDFPNDQAGPDLQFERSFVGYDSWEEGNRFTVDMSKLSMLLIAALYEKITALEGEVAYLKGYGK